MFCVQETKLNNIDVISLNNYTFLSQTRKQKFIRHSGGIGVFIKNELLPFVKIKESESDYILWLQFSKQTKKSENDFILGIDYQPPEGSKFLTEDETELLDVEMGYRQNIDRQNI